MPPILRLLAAGAALWLVVPDAGQAAPPPLSVPVSGAETAGAGPGHGGILFDLQRSNFLLGDLFGLRSLLSRYGVTLAIQETSEVLANSTGSVHQGVAYDGLTQAILQVDTQRAFGWYGGLFNVSALHQRDLRAGFIKIFDRMSKFDMLNQFVTHVGGGMFACPRGVKPGGYVGQSLVQG